MSSKSRIWLGVLLVGLSTAMSLFGCNCDLPDLIRIPAISTSLAGQRLRFEKSFNGKTLEETFSIWNSGQGTLTIERIKIEQELDGQVSEQGVFSLVNPTAFENLTIEPGRENGKKITIQYSPLELKEYKATIVIESPDADNANASGRFEISLSSARLRPEYRWGCYTSEKKFLDFGAIGMNRTEIKTCELTNLGNAPLIVRSVKYVKLRGSNPDKDEFEWISPKFSDKKPLTIGPDKKIVVKLSFTPKDYSLRLYDRVDDGHFVIESNISIKQGLGDLEKMNLRVQGTVLSPEIQVLPEFIACESTAKCTDLHTSYSCEKDPLTPNAQKHCRQALNLDHQTTLLFPKVTLGKSITKKFRIRNVGHQPLIIEKMSILEGGDILHFEVTPPKLPLTILEGKEQEISVVYAPKSQPKNRDKFVATISIKSNAGGRLESTINLEADLLGCDIQTEATRLRFLGPNIASVTIGNVGKSPCVVYSVQLKSGKTDPFTTLPKEILDTENEPLNPNQPMVFKVKFTPADNNEATDQIVIKSSDQDTPELVIDLKGEVPGNRKCELLITPTHLKFDLLPLGRSEKKSLALKNTGWGECVLSEIKIGSQIPAGHDSFHLRQKNLGEIRLGSNRSFRLDVDFVPQSENLSFKAVLSILSNDTKSPESKINLEGSAGTLCLEVIPPRLDFGVTKVHCATMDHTVSIFNIGLQKAACALSKGITIKGLKFDNDLNKEFHIREVTVFKIDGTRKTGFIPTDLKPGESAQVRLRYRAENLGIDNRSGLLIENNVKDQEFIRVPLIGEGVASNEQTDVFEQLIQPKTDILFIVDNSCSMREEQTNMAVNFESFIKWAVKLNVDYHIMITTTDPTHKSGPNAMGCAVGSVGEKIIKPKRNANDPDPILIFRKNINVGTGGAGNEWGLEAAYRSLIPPATRGCNQGFHRLEASMSLILVSDEKDQSDKPLDFYTNFFRSLKGVRNSDLIRASVVVGLPPNGCKNPGTGDADSAPRYVDFANQMKGISQSICDTNFGQTLSNLGSVTFSQPTAFFLTRQADPRTIVVKVNGAVVPEDVFNGWDYEASNNTINFSKSTIPLPGATIEVSYRAVCLSID